jgi:peptide/nickel transport system substrate-binding protein
MNKVFCAAMLVMVVFFSAACGSDEKPERRGSASEQAEPLPGEEKMQPQYGGRIIMGTIGEPSNLIPPLATDGSSHEVAAYFYVAPLKYDKDLNITTEAAESYEILEEGTLLRFTLRKGILWDDGVELTTEDVRFTYELMIDPETPTAYAEDYRQIKEFKALDRYTFEVRYDQPFARSLITWMHGILPRHALEGENLLDTKLSRAPLSAGPYRLKEWVPGQRLILEARDDYFEGRAYIDQIIYRIIPDQATMFMEAKAGNMDFMSLSPQQFLYQTKGPQWERDFRKYKYLAFAYTYLGYNLKKPMFADVRVRQALTHAIDKEEIVKGVLLGLGLPTIGPFKPGTWVYNEEIRDYPYDPERAKELLAGAGWTDSDGDGLLDKDGKPFAFTILTNQGNDLRIKTATIIQNRLKDVGIKVDIRTVEWAAFLKEFIDKGRFDAMILGWNILQDPDIFDVWHSSKIGEGGLNHVGYANPEVDRLLHEGRTTMDRKERKQIYGKLQEILHQDQPYCFLYVPYALPMVHSRFQDIEPAPSGITYNFIRWWVPESLQRYKAEQ